MKKVLVLCMLTLLQFSASALDKKALSAQDEEATVRAKQIAASLIKPQMSEFEKALILHEYITDNVTYGKLNNVTSAYTALVHNQSDCVGFARGLHRLYAAAGLDSFVVVRKKGHLWVKVRIRGKYYNVDATWSAVKSRWPQYNWFLLSDAQNVDEEKGLDHVLDSGEKYEAAPDEFVFAPEDYSHKSLVRSKQKLRIMGTISLPKGQKAPAGGIFGSINRIRFCIPQGKSSAFYITSMERDASSALLRVRLSRDPEKKYAPDSYYTKTGMISGSFEAFRFDTAADDYTGIDLTLLGTEAISAGGTRPVRPVYSRIDRLAADEISAKYRTGVIETAAEKVPAAVENAMFASPGETTVKAFCSALMSGTNDPFVKAKRIHDWMTLKIAYDSDLLTRMASKKDPNGSVEPLGVLKYRRSNCEGLARLYEYIAKASGLDAHYVTGWIKRSENRAGNLTSHAWNHVAIDGRKYIIDCSADTRMFWNAGKTSKMMDYDQKSDHLFIHPEAKRCAYLAQKPEDQLAGKIMTLEDFRASPRVEVPMYKFGLSFVEDSALTRSVYRDEKSSGGGDLFDLYQAPSGVLTMRLRAPDDVYLLALVADAAGKTIQDRGYAQRSGGFFTCTFSLPSSGLFQGTITARSLADPERVNTVYSFRITSGKSGPAVPASIVTSYYAQLQGVSLSRIYLNESTGKIIAECVHPSDIKVISFVRDPKDAPVSGAVRAEAFALGTRFEYTLPVRTGFKIVVAGMPVPDTAGRGNQRMFTIDAAGVVK